MFPTFLSLIFFIYMNEIALTLSENHYDLNCRAILIFAKKNVVKILDEKNGRKNDTY